MTGPQPPAPESQQAEAPDDKPRSAAVSGVAVTSGRATPAWLSSRSLWFFGIVALAVVAAPAALGLVGKFFFDGAHRPVETVLDTNNGEPDLVTALAWASVSNGPLYVGTQSGRVVTLGTDGSLQGTRQQMEGGTSTGLTTPVVSITPTGASAHLDVILDGAAANRADTQFRTFSLEQNLPDGIETSVLPPRNGLIAIGTATTFVVTGDCSTCLIAVRDESGKAVASKPTEPLPEVDAPVLAAFPTGTTGVDPVDFADMIDVRQIVAMPGRDFVIAGDGEGNLVQFKAEQRSADGTMQGGLQERIGGHDDPIVALAAATAADGSAIVASAAADGTIKAWRAPAKDDGQGSIVFVFDESTLSRSRPSAIWTASAFFPAISRGFTRGLAADSGVTRLAAVDGDGNPNIVSIDSTMRGPTAADQSDPRFAAFTRDGRKLLIEQNQTITLYSLTETEAWTIQEDSGGQRRSLVQAVFDPTGKRWAVVSDDDSISIQDASSREILQSLSTSHLPVTDVAFDETGNLLVIGSRDGWLEVWNLDTNESFDLAVDEDTGLSQVAFSPDGKRLLTLDREGTFRSVSARTLRGLDVVRAAASGGAFSADGGLLAVPFSTRVGFAINIIDTTTGETVSEVRTELNDFNFLAVSNDGRRIVVVTEDAATLWARTDGPEEASTATIPVARDGLRLSADGSTLLVREPSGALHVARLLGDDALRLREVALPVPALEASLTADGSEIVASGADAIIRVVPSSAGGVDTGFEILGHGEMVNEMAISPDSQYLASASIDGRVRITNLERARWIAFLPMARLPSHPVPSRMSGRRLETRADLPVLTTLDAATADAARCASGFVWREARPEDLVCVTPESRARVARENTAARSLIEPGGGAFGPNTCLPGFVWREAFGGDTVCVTPEIRELVREENRLGPSRLARVAPPPATIEDAPAALR